MRSLPAAFCTTCLLLLVTGSSRAADWVTWRGDSGRSAATDALPDTLHRHWTVNVAPPRMAWPEDPRLHFDRSLEPIVANGTIYLASNRTDSVTAFDLISGAVRWTAFADGPIRFAPIYCGGKLYFGADDGYFYCLDAKTGKRRWRFRAAPSDRRAIGSERLISVWPIRGGAVRLDDQLYFTSGVWPFEGTRLFRVEINDESTPTLRSFTLPDLTPQGYLVVSGSRIFIPCGRASAACFDTKTEKMVSFKYTSSGKTDYHVVGNERFIFHGDRVLDLSSGKLLASVARRPIFSKSTLYGLQSDKLVAYDLNKIRVIETVDRRGKKKKQNHLAALWQLPLATISKATGLPVKTPVSIQFLAGNTIYGFQGQKLFALRISDDNKSAAIVWTSKVAGTPSRMIAADGHLLVATRDGFVHCFGATEPGQRPDSAASRNPRRRLNNEEWSARVQSMLKELPDASGYAVVLGVGEGHLVERLILDSTLKLVVVDGDRDSIERLRRKYYRDDLYGERVVAVHAQPDKFRLPPYMASLIASEKLSVKATPLFMARMYQSLRPYGGVMWIAGDAAKVQQLSGAASTAKLAKAELRATSRDLLIKRPGALPGAADWRHEYGDVSNTLMSQDQLVKAPLGVLWFGGPAASGDLFFNRHYWAPSLVVNKGRMYMQGPQVMSCIDIYTGRVLWKKKLAKGVSPGRRGNFFEKVKVGYHFVAAEDAIYLSDGKNCELLEPASGEVIRTLKPPKSDWKWGRMRIVGDLLVSTFFAKDEFKKPRPKHLVAMNRRTGKVVWQREARFSVPFVAIGNGKLYYYDAIVEGLYDDWKRRGKIPPAGDFRYLRALDVKTGRPLWERTTGSVVTWLGYSPQQDVLISSNKEGMEAWNGKSGQELWKKKADGKGFKGHPESLWDKVILWNDRIIDQRGPGLAYDLKTGKEITKRHPISGEPIRWEFTKVGHHCNYAIANPHMVTFRAGSAGFLDLESANTSRLNGFRSGCRNSLIPAGGILNSPNFAHGCSCSYSLFTSLALVHVPEADLWSYSAIPQPKSAARQVGINLGAPGDRQAANGTLWLDYPNVGGSSPKVGVRVTGKPEYFRGHSEEVAGPLSWVASSGCRGMDAIHLDLATKKATSYTVRLYFVEAKYDASGKRLFDVAINGKPRLSGLDVYQQAGGKNRGLMREFKDVTVERFLTIAFTASKGAPICSGVEVIANQRPTPQK